MDANVVSWMRLTVGAGGGCLEKMMHEDTLQSPEKSKCSRSFETHRVTLSPRPRFRRPSRQSGLAGSDSGWRKQGWVKYGCISFEVIFRTQKETILSNGLELLKFIDASERLLNALAIHEARVSGESLWGRVVRGTFSCLNVCSQAPHFKTGLG